MKAFLISLLLFLSQTGFSAKSQNGEKPNSLRLVVIVVVDQLIPRYFEEGKIPFTKELSELKQKSLYYPRTRFSFVPTETAPGHAAIITGAPPQKTGIIGNDWFDRKKQKKVYAVSDEKNEFSPNHLLVPTIGDQLKKVSAHSKVVSVSLKDRSAIILGGQAADYSLWFDKKERRFVTSNYYGPPLSWLEDFNDQKKSEFPSLISLPKFLVSPIADTLTREMAIKTIEEFKLGQDEVTDLLCISFSGVDNVGHHFGPDSEKMKDQLINLDQQLDILLKTVANVSESQFLFILTSDHGVLPVPESPEGQKINAKRWDKKTFKKSLNRAIEEVFSEGKWVKEVLIPDIYFDESLVKNKGLGWEDFLTKAAARLKSVPGVAMVYSPPSFIEQDEFTSIYKRSYYAERSGDLFLRLAPGVLLSDWGQGTSHGSPYDYDAVVPLFFYGPFIKEGKKIDREINMESLAPTILQFLDIPFKMDKDYPPLIEITSTKP